MRTVCSRQMILCCILLTVAGAVMAAPVLEAGVVVTRFEYKESMAPPVKSAEAGWLPVLHLGLHSADGTRQFYRGVLEYTGASTTYNGTTIDGSQPLHATTNNTMLRAEGLVGWPVGGATVYTGIGGRYWDRRLNSGAAYSEQYRWAYVPVGVRMPYRGRSLSGAVDLSLRPMIAGDITVQADELFNDPAYSPITARLGLRVGARIEAPLAITLSPRTTFTAAPWYEYSAIGRSSEEPALRNGQPTGVSVVEPASRTHQYGLQVGMGYAF